MNIADLKRGVEASAKTRRTTEECVSHRSPSAVQITQPASSRGVASGHWYSGPQLPFPLSWHIAAHRRVLSRSRHRGRGVDRGLDGTHSACWSLHQLIIGDLESSFSSGQAQSVSRRLNWSPIDVGVHPLWGRFASACRPRRVGREVVALGSTTSFMVALRRM